MRQRRKISQREAVRNRRELRKLREFVDRISGSGPDWDAPVVQVNNLDPQYAAKLNGMMWGARYKLVTVAYFADERTLAVRVVRVPQEVAK